MTITRRTTAVGLALLPIILLAPLGTRLASQQSHTQLLMVVDGLRPDYVTPEIMPRLYALGSEGVLFTAHHSVFPTVTRVNSSSIATGSYPESHGLLGNTVYSPKAFPTKGIDTSDYEQLEAMEKAEDRLLTVPTLGETLHAAGKTLLVVSAGSSGSAVLVNHPLMGSVINVEVIQPSDVRDRIVAALGPGPAETVPNNARNKWAVDALLTFGLKELKSDVTVVWFGDPDATAHQKGVGTPVTIEALKFVDDQIGRIVDTLHTQGLLEGTDILVTSDHGFSTHTGKLRLATTVAPFAHELADGSPDIIVTEGAINFRNRPDPARVAAVVAELQKRPEVGAIFTRPVEQGSMKGTVPGTLSFNVPRWNHARSAEILVSANWNDEKNDAGFAGKTTQTGVAGHGTSSPFDVHNTLIARGPDFKQHFSSSLPTANVDIAPTLLTLLGLPIPTSMTGRVIEEALRANRAAQFPKVEHLVETASTADGTYRLDAHLSVIAGHRYFDYTEVHRDGR